MESWRGGATNIGAHPGAVEAADHLSRPEAAGEMAAAASEAWENLPCCTPEQGMTKQEVEAGLRSQKEPFCKGLICGGMISRNGWDERVEQEWGHDLWVE